MDKFTPKPIFGGPKTLSTDNRPTYVPKAFQADYEQAILFLISYRHNKETFMSFRREIERFTQWIWFFAKLSISKLTVQDIENYLQFCRKPPANWIALKTVAKFIEQKGERVPNPQWRPFVARLSKVESAADIKLLRSRYSLSEKGFKEIFTILHCFYKHLIEQEYESVNLIDRIKQKSRFYRQHQSHIKIRRISTLQWDFVIETVEKLANDMPEKHERTLFIMSIFYGMYLRISELTSSERWTPTMNDFTKDHEDNWWFTTVGKGNKQRNIAVSDSVLTALIRWRKYLKTLTPLPFPNENTPLITSRSPDKPIRSTRQIRNIVQICFDASIERMRSEGFEHDANELAQATVHWIRHTGISDDVKHRPREHVRDDAGHSSSQITDRYIDVDIVERHSSAKNKKIK